MTWLEAPEPTWCCTSARLEAYGCPRALVQHHVGSGASNHVTAAYECLLHAEQTATAAATAPGA